MTELLKKLSLILNGAGSSNLPAQEFYRTLALVSPVGIFQTDAEGRCVYVNERWCEFTGLSPAEAAGQGWNKALHPEDRERVVGLWEASVGSDRLFKAHYRFQRPDGKIIWVHGESMPITDDAGEITGYVGTVTDVTDRVEAEIRLENAQQHLRGILDNSTEAIISISENQHITFFNQSAELLFGYKEAEVLGEPLDILLPRETMPRHVEYIKRFGTGARGSKWMNDRAPIAGVRKDGARFVAQASIARFDLHGERIYSVMMRDVTREIEAEEDLKKNESSLAKAQRIGHMGNWDWDIVAGKLAWSDEIYRIFGLEPQEFGATYEAFLNSVYPEDRDFVKKSVDGALAGEPYDIDHRIITSGGEVRHVHEQGEVMFDDDGGPIRMVGIVQDITERKLAVEALKASEQQVRLLLDSTAEAIYGLDLEGNCTLANPACLRMLGYDRLEAVLGKKMHDLMHHTRPDGSRLTNKQCRIYQAFRRDEGTHVDDEVLWRADGTSFPAEYWSYPVHQDGKVIGAVVTFLDITERKRTEEALRESEARYRTVVEGSPGYIFLLNREGNILDLDMPRELVDKPAVLVTTHIYDFVYEGDRERFKHEVRLCSETNSLRDFEILNYDQSFTYQVLLSPISKSRGEPENIVCNIYDITERKQAEEALAEKTIYLDNILRESTEYAIATTDLDFRITYYNPMAEKLHGYKAEEVIGKTLQEMHTKEKVAPERLEQAVENIRRYGEHSYTVVQEKKEGTRYIDTRISGIYDANGELVGFANFARDITKRKLAEEALAAERERLAITLRSITDGVITTDADGKVVLVNRAGEELIGRSQEESAGRPLEEIFRLVHEKTGEPLEIPLNKVLLGENGASSENRAILISRDGGRIPVEEGASPLRDKDSRIIGIVLVFRDRSDRIHLESEIQRGQKLESLGELAGGLAHDFNNFLMGINLKVSTAELKARHDPDLRELLKSAQDSIQRAKGITQQLLTFAKGGEPVKTVLDFQPFLKEAVKFAIHGSRAAAHFNLDEGLWPVEIDQGQITQVVNNLVINAVQAMPAGGKLTVTAGNIVVDGNNPYGPLEHGSYVEVAVQDTGVGIPQNIIDNIFDPYFTTRSHGSGLGLFSCYSIVDKHGGWMTVESEVDQGSTFTFYLPAARKDVVEVPPVGEVVGGTGHILVVDDEETIRSGMEELLEVLDYKVQTAPDGEEGLALYRHYLEIGEPFDLAILDLTIPGAMAGEEIARRLREITPDLKMIVASGYSTDPIMAHYRDYGFQGVLVKPFSAEELSQILAQLLSSD